MTSWKRPSPGTLKLNTYAALKIGLVFIGLGGVIRDDLGQVLIA